MFVLLALPSWKVKHPYTHVEDIFVFNSDSEPLAKRKSASADSCLFMELVLDRQRVCLAYTSSIRRSGPNVCQSEICMYFSVRVCI